MNGGDFNSGYIGLVAHPLVKICDIFGFSQARDVTTKLHNWMMDLKSLTHKLTSLHMSWGACVWIVQLDALSQLLYLGSWLFNSVLFPLLVLLPPLPLPLRFLLLHLFLSSPFSSSCFSFNMAIVSLQVYLYKWLMSSPGQSTGKRLPRHRFKCSGFVQGVNLVKFLGSRMMNHCFLPSVTSPASLSP